MTTETAEMTTGSHPARKPVQELEEVTVRFAGDSGDGMQLVGTQFTRSSVIFGNDVCTFPDYPAEIRAPAGTLAGVSGFQITFSSHDILTPGDKVDALVALNPAALKASLGDVRPGGVVIVNEDAFGKTDLKKAGYETNPLEDDTLKKYQLYKVPISTLNRKALEGSGLGPKEVDRCKNFFSLGVVYWLYGRPMEPTIDWLDAKFGKNPVVCEANKKVLKAGYFFGETCEYITSAFKVAKATLPPGKYRRISGNEAISLGLITAAHLAGKDLFYGTYPITPASDILHTLAMYKNYRVKTFQAEDEIAAVCAAIGASFAGALAATGTSGPGLDLKGEAIGLAVMTELPLVIIDVQRGGPSTGLPTKPEQSDLLHAVFGRHGECPLCVIAASSPSDCFDAAIEASRIAMQHMTPVILLSDGFIANGEEPWRIPDYASLPKITVTHPTESNDGNGFLPYQRDEDSVRPWVLPGTPNLMHRIGGLEKKDVSGGVCYEPENHQRMTELRATKIANIAEKLPLQTVQGPAEGDLLVLTWGGTAGAAGTAVSRVQKRGCSVAFANVRHLHPLPRNLGPILANYRQVLIPELNTGQFRFLIRGHYGIDAVGLNKIQGKPFLVSEIESKIMNLVATNGGNR
ncbi:MAG TPA: 2-oxoacid:acceptor oxidoreductase subunit alpha [Phycisphaerae bacterium]|nr:2-oxoacid:acceptor oxidoreductase subunit alpha [Phycisphaerae bacterium]